MSYQMIKFAKNEAIATITLNRPEKYNTLRLEMLHEMENALMDANQDDEMKVIVLEGAGDSFCGGFDFSGGLEHYEKINEDGYDPGVDIHWVTNSYTSYIPKFMGLWRGLKPTIAKVHGYCVGGGSELALCADLIIASDDARFGTPYSRVWGCHLTGMWVYRLGLAKAKYYALTGEWVSGKEAAEIELINFAYPLEELDQRVDELARKLAMIPLTQLTVRCEIHRKAGSLFVLPWREVSRLLWKKGMDRLATTVRAHERISHEKEVSWIRLDTAAARYKNSKWWKWQGNTK